MRQVRCMMKIICVGSAVSGLGKTTVCELILRTIPGLCALKVTTRRAGDAHMTLPEPAAPAPGDSACYIEDASEVLLQQGKDTQRMLDAGASRALWLYAAPEKMEQGVRQALAGFGSCSGIVVEGNTPMLYLPHSLKIFILGEGSRIKPSAEAVMGRADILLGSPDAVQEFREACRDSSPRLFVYPAPGEMTEFLHQVKKFMEQNGVG